MPFQAMTRDYVDPIITLQGHTYLSQPNLRAVMIHTLVHPFPAYSLESGLAVRDHSLALHIQNLCTVKTKIATCGPVLIEPKLFREAVALRRWIAML